MRPNSLALDRVLGEAFPILDHGFVRVIDYMGDDAAVVQAARVSYGDGTRSVRDDRGLIRYLMRHRHSSPFEMCEIKLHVKLPIFVARQWIRHRTANVNEVSARYSELTDDVYVPDVKRLAHQSASNRQGSGELLDEEDMQDALISLSVSADRSVKTYKNLLGVDLARELARGVLTVNHYTEWYWKIDLRNLLHFLSLRADSHAQYEIRVYADVIAKLVEAWVPVTYAAWEDYQREAVTLSGPAVRALQKALACTRAQKADLHRVVKEAGLSEREARETLAALGLW